MVADELEYLVEGLLTGADIDHFRHGISWEPDVSLLDDRQFLLMLRFLDGEKVQPDEAPAPYRRPVPDLSAEELEAKRNRIAASEHEDDEESGPRGFNMSGITLP